ncbi:ECF transporter S component [Candidatus Bathyarchaeota archaeon]|nr:ECF transporter S component [Candidatus Bathyarchaeota archaeon]
MGEDSDGSKKMGSPSVRTQEQRLGSALKLALIAISAALYAVAKGATAIIPTPWGVGQVLPGVIFPAVFAVIYGPVIGAVGAAIGTFVGDVLFLVPLGQTTPLMSLIAGVPGNFVGFFLLGWFTRKYRSWNGFIFGSFISLLIGNLIAGSGVVACLSPSLIGNGLSLNAMIGMIFGFTFFWLVTMIPFVIPLVPPLVRSLQPVVGAQIDVGLFRLKRGSGHEALRSSLAVGGILGVLFMLVQFTPLGDALLSNVISPDFIPYLKFLFLAAALVVLIFGVVASLLLRQPEKK